MNCAQLGRQQYPDQLIGGTPDEVRDQLKQRDGLTDEVILYPPSIGIAPERVQENLDAMIDTFAR